MVWLWSDPLVTEIDRTSPNGKGYSVILSAYQAAKFAQMTPIQSPAAFDEVARRRSIGFLNWAHALDHFVLLIYPTVVIGLEVVYGLPYSELIALSSTAFLAFGIFSLPAGWLADRWSRRNMMAAFFLGCGVSLAAIMLRRLQR